MFIRRRPPSRAAGLPHSETHGSRPADGSPWNIAVCRVLLRLMTPRHPSCARIRLARNFLASRLRCNSLQFQSSGCQGSSRLRGDPLVAANGCIVYQTRGRRARGKTKKIQKSDASERARRDRSGKRPAKAARKRRQSSANSSFATESERRFAHLPTPRSHDSTQRRAR